MMGGLRRYLDYFPAAPPRIVDFTEVRVCVGVFGGAYSICCGVDAFLILAPCIS